MQALLAFVGVVAAGALIKSGIRWFFRERPKRSGSAPGPVSGPAETKGRDKIGK